MKSFTSSTAKLLYAALLVLFIYARYKQQMNNSRPATPSPAIPGSPPPAAGLQPAPLGINRKTVDWINNTAREMRHQPAPVDSE